MTSRNRDADPFRRSVDAALRAYPRRYRETRGPELLDLLTDLAEPGATRLPLRTRTDLLRAGLALRLRDRPPVLAWAGYRLLGRRLPDRWRGWIRDDIDGVLYPVRQLLLMVLTQAAVTGLISLTVGNAPGLIFAATYLGTSVVVSYVLAGVVRTRALIRYGLAAGGAGAAGAQEPR